MNKEAMKICLIDPLHKVWEFFRGYTAAPGLVALAAYLEREGYNVDVFDATVADHPWRDLHMYLLRERPQVIGLTSQITMLHNDPVNAARLIRSVLPDTKIIVGGMHAAALAEDHLRMGLFDAVVLWEGEVSTTKLMDAWAAGSDISKVPGIAYLDNENRLVKTELPEPLDINSLPRGAYHLFPMERYNIPALGGKVALAATFSRGCPYKCNFCPDSHFWKHTMRQMSGEIVAEELKRLDVDYNRHVFYIGDDNFMHYPERVEEFVKAMEKLKPNVALWLQTTCASVLQNKDILPRLRKVGVYQIMMGIETVKPEVLARLNKPHNMRIFEEAVDLVDKHGFIVFGMLMWGHWDDTLDELKATLKYLSKHTDVIAPNITTPYPGTRLYDEAKELGLIMESDWSKFDQMTTIMPTKEYSMEEAQDIYGAEVGKALMLNPRTIKGTLFLHKHPLLRTYLRQFFKMGYRLAINKPWVQKNWQPFEEYIRKEFRVVEGSHGVSNRSIQSKPKAETKVS